jgi:transcriptional regulator with XRE-family HTH domain
VEEGAEVVAPYKIHWSEDQRETFVRRWVAFRGKYGLTQRQLAEAMGTHYNTVCRVERGHYYPNNETVLRFEEVERRFKAGEEVQLELRKPGWVMEAVDTARETVREEPEI